MWEKFPAISTAQWLAAIRAESKSADFAKELVFEPEDGILARPFYRKEDLPTGTAAAGRFPGPWRSATVAEIPGEAVRGDLLHEQGATAVQEVGYALAESAGKRDTFVLSCGVHYFIAIAKLRAARQLWARISEVPMVIWSRTSPSSKSPGDPADNLVQCTTEAMSAIFGGCDVLVVQPAGFSTHLAESLPRVLAEEAHLDKVGDPAGGSYYIESLTASIAAEAWKIFETGIAGRDAAIAAAREKRRKVSTTW